MINSDMMHSKSFFHASAQETQVKDEPDISATASAEAERIAPIPVLPDERGSPSTGPAAPMRYKEDFLWDLLEQNFTFDAVISVLDSSDELSKTPVRAIMDTGSEAFMIHEAIVRRAKLAGSIQAAEGPSAFRGLNKVTYRSTRCVKVTWHVPKHMNSREDVFHVVEDGPFDILIPNVLDIGMRSMEESLPRTSQPSRNEESKKKSYRKSVLYIGRPWKRSSKSSHLCAKTLFLTPCAYRG